MNLLRIISLPVVLVLLHSAVSAQDFRVQIAAFDGPKPDTYFTERGIARFFVSTDQLGIYRYFAGSYPNRDEAEKVQQQVLEKGFPYAYVIDLEEQRILCGANCPYFRNGIIIVNDTAQEKSTRIIYFDFGRYSLTEQARTDLDEMVQLLKENPASNLHIKGYTDGVGDAQANIQLASERSRAARNYLIAKGIRADRMFIKVYGESDPAGPNQNDDNVDLPENRKYNRRVVLSLTEEN